MSILEGLAAGIRQGQNYAGVRQQRRLAEEENKRANRRLELDENQESRLAAAEQRAIGIESDANRERDAKFEDTQLARRQRDASRVYSNMLADGFTEIDDEGFVGLSGSYKTKLLDGDEFAQGYFLQKLNFAKRDFVPADFKVDRINQTVDPETGERLFTVGGSYEDGRGGVLTESGASDDSAAGKLFTEQELFGLARTAFRGTDGILQTQTQQYGGYDRTAYRNAINLGLTQGNIFDKLSSNPAAQRQVQAILGSAETPKEEVELTNQIAADVGVAPVKKEESAETDTEQKQQPEDNSDRIAELEAQLREIQARPTAGKRGNVNAASKIRAEIRRLQPKPKDSNAGRTRGERKFAPLPAVVEEQLAPTVENKTKEEIDALTDNGEVVVTEAAANAMSKELQQEGVETVEDIVKLDPRRQMYMYAMLVAAAPEGNRPAIRDKMTNILETGISDRGESVRKTQDTVSRQLNAETNRGEFKLKYDKYVDQLDEGSQSAANDLFEQLQDVIYPIDPETGQAQPARLNRQSANTLANRIFPQLRRERGKFIRAGNLAGLEAIDEVMNQTLSFIVQSVANDANPGLLDKFFNLFNQDPSGNFDGDLSNIFKRDGKFVYMQGNRVVGDPLPVGALKNLNVNLFKLVDDAATQNNLQKQG
jgi:hypothetical protein